MNRAVTALRIIDTGVKPARWNIAATAALLELHRIGATPDTIRFHRYPRSVLIGRNQALDREVDIERCHRTGVEIARRVTGGGAVYMSSGILAWDIVAGRSRLGDSLGEVTLKIGSAIAAGLRRLGSPAKADAQGAVDIQGRKVSGSSGGFDGPAEGLLLVHNTLVDRHPRGRWLRLADGQRQVLAGLNYSIFRAADDSYLDPIREMIADQKLGEARAKGDTAAAAAAERELQRLRSLREVRP